MTTQNARKIDNTAEDTYWKGVFQNESYYQTGNQYDDYQSAYRTGYEGYGRYGGKPYDQVENDLKSDWEKTKGNTQLAWDKAKYAVKAAWHRVERAIPGDADRDAR